MHGGVCDALVDDYKHWAAHVRLDYIGSGEEPKRRGKNSLKKQDVEMGTISNLLQANKGFHIPELKEIFVESGSETLNLEGNCEKS